MPYFFHCVWAKSVRADPLRTVAERGFAKADDIASAVLFLAGTGARLVTGIDLPVDAGLWAA